MVECIVATSGIIAICSWAAGLSIAHRLKSEYGGAAMIPWLVFPATAMTGFANALPNDTAAIIVAIVCSMIAFFSSRWVCCANFEYMVLADGSIYETADATVNGHLLIRIRTADGDVWLTIFHTHILELLLVLSLTEEDDDE